MVRNVHKGAQAENAKHSRDLLNEVSDPPSPEGRFRAGSAAS